MPETSPVPDARTLTAIAQRFGLGIDAIRPLPQGEANHSFLLGDSLVLRIPRNDPALMADLRKEVSVIPTASAAGVRTPALVLYDDGSVAGVPFMVLERVAGTDLERLPADVVSAGELDREVGRQLARLHQIAWSASTSLVAVPVDAGDRNDPRELLRPLVADGRLDEATADWLDQRFGQLATMRLTNPPRVLIHGDIAPRNLLADSLSGRLTGVIDWGDAAWADPAVDFAKLPLARLLDVLTGYLEDETVTGDLRSWQARAFHHHLHWAIAAIGRRDPDTGQPRGSGAAFARLMVILRFLVDTPDRRWRSGWGGPAG